MTRNIKLRKIAICLGFRPEKTMRDGRSRVKEAQLRILPLPKLVSVSERESLRDQTLDFPLKLFSVIFRFR